MSPTRTVTDEAVLTDFVLARVSEDDENTLGDAFSGEVEAKRIRIALLTAMVANTSANLLSSYGYLLLCIEALPYAGHPDYRDEWTP